MLRGYVNLSLKQQGREFTSQCLESYERNERKRRAEARAQIHRTVLRAPFELETVEFTGTKPAALRGWYKGGVDVEAVVSFGWSMLFCAIRLVLVGDRVIVEPQVGELYRKVLQDVIHTMESPSGRLWRLKSGSEVFWTKALEVMREIARGGGR